MLCHVAWCVTVILFLCVSACQVLCVVGTYDRKLPTPSAGTNDLYLVVVATHANGPTLNDHYIRLFNDKFFSIILLIVVVGCNVWNSVFKIFNSHLSRPLN